MRLFCAIAIVCCAGLLHAQTVPVNPAITEASRLMRANDSGGAIRVVKSALEKDPKNQDLRLFLVAIFAEGGRFDDAMPLLLEMRREDPNSTIVLARLGEAYFSKGDRAKALESFNKAAEVSYTNPAFLITFSGTFMRPGGLEVAEMIDEALLRLRPNDALMANNLSYTLAEQNKELDRALELAQIAVSRQPNSAPYVDTLGWVYFKKGRLEEAFVPLCRALAMQVTGEAYQAHVLKLLDTMTRLSPDQHELRDRLRGDNEVEGEARLQELASKLAGAY